MFGRGFVVRFNFDWSCLVIRRACVRNSVQDWEAAGDQNYRHAGSDGIVTPIESSSRRFMRTLDSVLFGNSCWHFFICFLLGREPVWSNGNVAPLPEYVSNHVLRGQSSGTPLWASGYFSSL